MKTFGTSTDGTSEYFTAEIIGNPDFMLANYVSLTISGGINADIEIDFFGSGIPVPEPSSLAITLTGLGFAGVYFRRRRKQLTA